MRRPKPPPYKLTTMQLGAYWIEATNLGWTEAIAEVANVHIPDGLTPKQAIRKLVKALKRKTWRTKGGVEVYSVGRMPGGKILARRVVTGGFHGILHLKNLREVKR